MLYDVERILGVKRRGRKTESLLHDVERVQSPRIDVEEEASGKAASRDAVE